MLLDARSLAESLRAPQTAVQGRAHGGGPTTSIRPHDAHSCRLLACCRIPLPALEPARAWWKAAPVARSTSDPAKPRRRRRTSTRPHPRPTPPAPRVPDIFALDAVLLTEHEDALEAVEDIASWIAVTRRKPLVDQVAGEDRRKALAFVAAARQVLDLDAPAEGYVWALEQLLTAAELTWMPDVVPGALLRLHATVCGRLAGGALSVVRCAPNRRYARPVVSAA